MINRVAKRHRYRSIFYAYRKKRGDKRHRRTVIQLSATIVLPECLDLFNKEFRQRLLNIVKNIHIILCNSNYTRICLDFQRTKRIYSVGMLYLYAEIKNIQNIYHRVRFSCIKSKESKVNHVLYQIGLFELCRHKFKKTKNFPDVIHWRASCGVDVISKHFDDIIDTKCNEILSVDMDIYGGCIEATKNAKVHAYLKQRKLSPVANNVTSWWAFSQVKDGYVDVAICDLGIGIAKTLPITKKKLWEKLRFMSNDRESSMIQGAIDFPRSRTKEKHRGNGLYRIASVAAGNQNASFAIYSGKGYAAKIRGEKKLIDYKTELPGTIVSWRLPLGGRDGND